MGRYSVLFLLCLLLTSCQVLSPVSDESHGEIYRPPTPAIDATGTYQAIQQQAAPLAAGENADNNQQSACIDNLVYIADRTIPDGTEVSSGAVLDKQWEVENQGTCNWGETYRLKLISGAEISAPSEQALFPARSGTKAIISIQITAPQEAGRYNSAWQAYSPSGLPFGDPIFIDIVVSESTPAS